MLLLKKIILFLLLAIYLRYQLKNISVFSEMHEVQLKKNPNLLVSGFKNSAALLVLNLIEQRFLEI
jgi:hypothetical protein